ncbi:MAG: cation:proton antiporter [Limnospira sp.]
MTILTIAAIALPLFVGFSIYLFPKLDRYLTLAVAIFSGVYGLQLLFNSSPLTLQLLDNFGVTVVADELSGYLILTNGLVTAAVILYCWGQGKTAFFYTQAIILHGSVNATFICGDLLSLYVALEVLGIAAFLLIAYPRTDRSIWVALRYLFVSNTAMLFYLVGVALVYQANHSFAFEGVRESPPEAIALILMGLLAKGGVFVSGLWLPLTHSESETPVSALLSGVVVKAGVFPLVRLALMVNELDGVMRIFGVATALLGATYAIFETDTKRMLAWSTISQLGFILVAPAAGGFYALTHGLVKSTLFLSAGSLPSRDFSELRGRPIPTGLWAVILAASLSISGFPLFAGFGAKALALKGLQPWAAIAMNVAAVGTATYFAKFIFLPHRPRPESELQKPIPPGFWFAAALAIAALVLGNGLYYPGYVVANPAVLKSLATIGLGWLAYWAVFRDAALRLPHVLEKLEHLIGMMSLMLILLFWLVLWRVTP